MTLSYLCIFIVAVNDINKQFKLKTNVVCERKYAAVVYRARQNRFFQNLGTPHAE